MSELLRNRYAATATVIAALGGGALAANLLGGHDGNNGAAVAAAEAQAATNQAQEACDVAPNLSANLADTNSGTPDSMFPKLSKVDSNGNEQLLSADEASAAVKKQLAGDLRVLSVWNTFVSTVRDPKHPQIPNSLMLAKAADTYKNYLVNPTVAEHDLQVACSEADMLVPTTRFAVTQNQGTILKTDRADGSGKVTGFEAAQFGGGLLSGFEINFNHDDKSLKAVEPTLDKIMSLLLITKDGTIVLNNWQGPNSFKIDQSAQNQPVTITVGGKTVKVMPRPQGTATMPSSSSQNQNANGGGSSGGSSSQGPKPESGPGNNNLGPKPNGPSHARPGGPTNSPAVGPGASSPGSTQESGPGQSGGQPGGPNTQPTTPTQPNTTPTQPNTTPTQPTTTPTQPTTTPTTPTSTNKGSESSQNCTADTPEFCPQG